jgi:hypothetical protein
MGAHILKFDQSATFWDETAQRNVTRSATEEDKEADGKVAKKDAGDDKKEEKKPDAPKAEEKK